MGPSITLYSSACLGDMGTLSSIPALFTCHPVFMIPSPTYSFLHTPLRKHCEHLFESNHICDSAQALITTTKGRERNGEVNLVDKLSSPEKVLVTNQVW